VGTSRGPSARTLSTTNYRGIPLCSPTSGAARSAVNLTDDVQSHAVDDDDALVCNSCGHEVIGERTAAYLLTQRALVPQADMSATTRRSRGTCTL
jgi:hypothetical protein